MGCELFFSTNNKSLEHLHIWTVKKKWKQPKKTEISHKINTILVRSCRGMGGRNISEGNRQDGTAYGCRHEPNLSWQCGGNVEDTYRRRPCRALTNIRPRQKNNWEKPSAASTEQFSPGFKVKCFNLSGDVVQCRQLTAEAGQMKAGWWQE